MSVTMVPLPNFNVGDYVQPEPVAVAEDEMLMFVYGILRPRDGEMAWFLRGGQVRVVVECCRALGTLYARGLAFADFTPPDDGSTILGALLAFKTDSRVLTQVREMESRAGYIAVSVTVTLPDDGVVEAEAWHYTKIEHVKHHAARVPDGDWLTWRRY